ncbi:MAG: SUF system Fe-S cluster assembly regulator [Oceanococcaceae bacterium]
MFRVSRLTDYALVLLCRMADAQTGAAAAAAQSAQQLARDVRLPLPMVSKALKSLNRAGWVQSQRGAQGGYRLARPAQDISVLAVVEDMEGPLNLAPCDGDSQCTLHAHCGLRGHWARINRRVRRELQGMTIAELVEPPALAELADDPLPPVASAARGRSDHLRISMSTEHEH